MLFSRQRQLLQLLDALGGTSEMPDFQKLLFLYCQESPAGEAPYDFVPYRFGAFSFTSYADRRKLVECGLLADEDGWRSTTEGRKAAERAAEPMSKPWVSLDKASGQLAGAKDTRGLPANRGGRLWKFNLTEVDVWVYPGETKPKRGRA